MFTDLRKQPCPPGHFQSEDDLFHAFVDSGGRLEFVAEEVAGWSDAQLIEQALTTGLIADKSDRHVSRDAPGWVSVVFGRAGSQYPQR